ncbi:hypothetical protein P5673_028095 [Acropora cervicornis]|uniref:Uncharacterized protein n=1 Tax=Acropora cervicornis TaxID=6130 RepID=A0AAD9UVI6_ACRCE|nr:hypothetical protein P5673_028095 [Acropora cervicornis]
MPRESVPRASRLLGNAMLISAHMSPDDEAVRMRLLRTSLRRVLDEKIASVCQCFISRYE